MNREIGSPAVFCRPQLCSSLFCSLSFVFSFSSFLLLFLLSQQVSLVERFLQDPSLVNVTNVSRLSAAERTALEWILLTLTAHYQVRDLMHEHPQLAFADVDENDEGDEGFLGQTTENGSEQSSSPISEFVSTDSSLFQQSNSRMRARTAAIGAGGEGGGGKRSRRKRRLKHKLSPRHPPPATAPSLDYNLLGIAGAGMLREQRGDAFHEEEIFDFVGSMPSTAQFRDMARNADRFLSSHHGFVHFLKGVTPSQRKPACSSAQKTASSNQSAVTPLHVLGSLTASSLSFSSPELVPTPVRQHSPLRATASPGFLLTPGSSNNVNNQNSINSRLYACLFLPSLPGSLRFFFFFSFSCLLFIVFSFFVR